MVKDISIKNRSYYFFNDVIVLKIFDEANLKNDKKYHTLIFITLVTSNVYGNIHSVNPLYLIIHSATGYFTEENGNKYLVLDSTNKYEEVWSGIRAEVKRINGGKELFYEKDHSRIKVDTDDDLPLNKTLKLPTFTIIVTAVFQEGEKLYTQIYLDECFIKTLE